MDTFKKIYKALMVITIISIIVLCLYSLGIIDLSAKMRQTGLDNTGPNILMITLSVMLMSFIFSRAGNVIANRKFPIVGYLTVFLGLLVLLGVAVFLMVDIKMSGTLSQILKIFTNIFTLLFLLVLVFEIPQSNKSHRTFQIITAVIITITFIFNAVTSNTNKSSSSSLILNNSSSLVTKKDNDSATDKIKTILLYASIGTFILNPMLRVYYIDKDYNEEKEIEEIIENSADNNTLLDIPNQNAILNDKYKSEKDEEKKIEIPKPVAPIPEASPVVEEVHHEKIINPNFKQDDLPEAIIPMINDQDNPETIPTENEAVEPIVNTNVSEEDKNQEPEVSTPLDQVTPVAQPSIENLTPPEVSTPLDQVVQPLDNQQ